jgi:hypothetical protein
MRWGDFCWCGSTEGLCPRALRSPEVYLER